MISGQTVLEILKPHFVMDERRTTPAFCPIMIKYAMTVGNSTNVEDCEVLLEAFVTSAWFLEIPSVDVYLTIVFFHNNFSEVFSYNINM